MTTDAIVIPCYDRAEMLAVCIEYLNRCDEYRDLVKVFALDEHLGRKRHSSIDEMLGVIDGQPKAVVLLNENSYHGNSYNVLTALMFAKYFGRFIFYVEEDVMVAKDFFRWHYAVHAREELFCSVAVQNQNSHVTAPPDPSLYYISQTDYSALGVCFPSASLDLLEPHVTPEYFSNMIGYIRNRFPNSRFGMQFSEQDGLIRRIIEADQLRVAWPCVPRAFHLAWYGYNRDGRRPLGLLADRIAQVKAIMFDKEEIDKRSGFYKDIIPCSLDGYAWSDIQRMKA